MTYAIEFRPMARKVLERLPRTLRSRIKEALRALRDNPYPTGSAKLNTPRGCYYRVRVGSYRIIYEVAHEIRVVTIIRVGHRKDVYRIF